MRVDVYYNLHKHCLSVRDRATRRVAHHASRVMLEAVRFSVSEAGRQRVLREQRKNVHAFVRGRLAALDTDLDDTYLDVEDPAQRWRRATYNPYRVSTFVDRDTGEPVHHATQVIVAGRAIYYR
jgi:hypothetical protein